MFGRLSSWAARTLRGLPRAVTARPWFVVAGWVVATVAILVLAPRLSQVTNADQAAFLPASTESAQAAQLAQRAFPGAQGATAVIVVHRADGSPLTDVDAARVEQLTQRLNQVSSPGVVGVVFDPNQSISRNGLVGTLGVAFMGMAPILGMSSTIAAGAIISGAYMGDKMSPLSETTVLVPSLVGGVSTGAHIRGMAWTVVPAFIVSLGVFLVVGLSADTAATAIDTDTARDALESVFTISPF